MGVLSPGCLVILQVSLVPQKEETQNKTTKHVTSLQNTMKHRTKQSVTFNK